MKCVKRPRQAEIFTKENIPTWEGELASSIFSRDFSLAKRAASLYSANLSANWEDMWGQICMYEVWVSIEFSQENQ